MNLPLNDRVILAADSDLSYGFDDLSPKFYLKTEIMKYPHTVAVDNFPCYTHDRTLAVECAKQVESRWPLPMGPFYYLLPFEMTSRTNGHCSQEWYQYEDSATKQERKHLDVIVLGGKRIPIHPCMTRYLVAHEYGHAANNYIVAKKGCEDSEFDQEYAKIRGIEYYAGYGARNWHKNTGEIIANDFRICICGVEPDFWPHYCEHPHQHPRINEYWYELMLNFL